MTTATDSKTLDRELAYAVFRLTLGINILVHGAGRIFGPGADAFAATTAVEFAKTPLPAGMVHTFPGRGAFRGAGARSADHSSGC